MNPIDKITIAARSIRTREPDAYAILMEAVHTLREAPATKKPARKRKTARRGRRAISVVLGSKRMTFQIKEELYAALSSRANSEGRSVHNLVGELLGAYDSDALVAYARGKGLISRVGSTVGRPNKTMAVHHILRDALDLGTGSA